MVYQDRARILAPNRRSVSIPLLDLSAAAFHLVGACPSPLATALRGCCYHSGWPPLNYWFQQIQGGGVLLGQGECPS